MGEEIIYTFIEQRRVRQTDRQTDVLVLYTFSKNCLPMYGGHIIQLHELIVPWSEPATFC